MRSFTVTLILLFVLRSALFAQSPMMPIWDVAFGGDSADVMTQIQLTGDGGFIIAGSSESPVSDDKTQSLWGKDDFWVVKTDSLGNKQWDKRFGGSLFDQLAAVQQTSDGGYLLGGRSMSPADGDKSQPNWGNFYPDYWIVKIDSLGNKQWDKRFGGSNWENLTDLKETSDHGFILGGSSVSDSTGDKTEPRRGNYDYWVLKIDSLGNKQWDKVFGGIHLENFAEIEVTADGGYLLGGTSYSGISGDKTQPNRDAADSSGDYWMVKISAAGQKQWDRVFGGDNWDVLQTVERVHDGFLLGGYSLSGISGDKTMPSRGDWDFWIVKIDTAGNKQWDQVFGGTDGDALTSISGTSDGGAILAGSSSSMAGGDKTEDNNLGVTQTWIIKIDSAGNKQWDKTIPTHNGVFLGYSIQINDRCYAVANGNSSEPGGYKTQLPRGELDYWIVKVCDSAVCNSLKAVINSYTAHVGCSGAQDGAAKAVASGGTAPHHFLWSNGQATDAPTDLPAGTYSVTVTDAYGCSSSASVSIAENEDPCTGIPVNALQNISLYPNPTDGTILLTGIPSRQGKASCTLFLLDPLGRELWRQTIPTDVLTNGVTLDLKEYEEGVYFLNILTESGSRVMKVVRY